MEPHFHDHPRDWAGDFNSEVSMLLRVISYSISLQEIILGLGKGDHNGKVTLLVVPLYSIPQLNMAKNMFQTTLKLILNIIVRY